MNAPRLRLVLAAASMSMAWSLVASAQTRSWDNYCTLGTFQACMSVEVSLVSVPTPFNVLLPTSTVATVSIRNLQGTLGTNEAWGFKGFSIQQLQPDPAPPFPLPLSTFITPTFVGTGQNVNAPHTAGIWDNGSSGSNGFINRSLLLDDGAYPIAGCAALTPESAPIPGRYDLEQGYFSTCGDGWVVYSFLMPPVQWSEATTVTMSGYHLSAAGTVEGFGCTFDVSCVSTTPEPATIVLVATGLIGLAGFRWRRSRATRTT
jgi:hypothetical protein